MKTFKLLTAGLAIITLLFTSCKKEEETQDETANLTLAKTSLTLKVGEYEKVAIKTGNGTYTATSSDITKATVSLVNNELTITALAEGLATVTVSDAKNRTADISVKVLDLVVPGEHITLLKGNTATRTISFGNDYKVATTDAAIATATIANNLLTIEAISKGNALVTVKDLVSEKVQTFSVTVESQPLALSVATVALTKGEKVAVAIVSGNSSYTVSVADTAVAAATVSGTTVTVTGVGVGTTKITVKDADDKTAELSVTVNAFSLTLERNAVEVNADAAVEVAIRSGNGNYTVQVADNSKATATIVGDKVRIEGKEAGTTKVTVKDSQNKTAEITVTVKPRGLSLERTALTINAGTTAEVAIFSGNGGYTVQVADNSKATATIVGNKVRIEAKAAGTTKVIVKDSQNKTAEITVTINPFNLSLERNALTINAGTTAEVAIFSGNGGYTVQVADNSKATATIVGNKVRIEGKAAGTTKVTVKDSQNKTAEISVTVSPRNLAVEKMRVELNAGANTLVAITNGNGAYTAVSEDNNKVTAQIEGNGIRITAKAAGTAKVTVKDSANKQVEIVVVVRPYNLTVDKTEVEVNVGATAEVAIRSGNGGYSVPMYDNTKVQVAIVGSTVRITGKAAGETSVTIKDSQNKTAEIIVTVKGTDLELAQANVEVNVGATTEVAIVKGTAPYSVSVINSSVATAQIIGGNKVRITGVGAGTTKVTVGDDQAKQAFIMVTVKAASTDDLFDIVEGEDIEEEDYKNERVIEVKGSASAISGDIVLPARGTVLADNTLEYSSVSSVDFNNVKIIGEGALHSSRNLTKVLLKKVTKIKSMAFAECDKLKEVRCYMNVPPTVESDAFDGIAEDTVLWVPRGKKGAYEAVEAFSSSFSEIKEM